MFTLHAPDHDIIQCSSVIPCTSAVNAATMHGATLTVACFIEDESTDWADVDLENSHKCDAGGIHPAGDFPQLHRLPHVLRLPR